MRDWRFTAEYDDNGTGTAALLELARVFAMAAQDGHRLKVRHPLPARERGGEGCSVRSSTGEPADPAEEDPGRPQHRHDRPQRRSGTTAPASAATYVIGDEKLNTKLH